MEVRLDGRSALITGGSLGLGYAMAHRFARAGARVALLARRAEPLAAAAARLAAETGATVWHHACDVSRAADIATAWAALQAGFGPVDILVNNAGVARAGPFAAATDDDWQADIDLKLMAAVRLARLALPGMRERRWGRVLNLLNTHAKAPGANSAPTSVTRAAGMALTKVLAAEYAGDNVLVNALLIGIIDSDQWHRRWGDPGSPGFAEARARVGERLPMGRIGEADECARLACFLVSDAASYVTGCAINMDGGMCPVA